MTNLDPHKRGDTFTYTFVLGNGWTGATFTGGVKFTLRTKEPPSTTVDDTDAVDQASVSGGEIVIAGVDGTIEIPASRTTTWATGKLYWDLQGVVTGSPSRTYTIDFGRIPITADITRSA